MSSIVDFSVEKKKLNDVCIPGIDLCVDSLCDPLTNECSKYNNDMALYSTEHTCCSVLILGRLKSKLYFICYVLLEVEVAKQFTLELDQPG